MEIVFASANKHKVCEINAVAHGSGVNFVLPSEGFDPVENGKTFIENATIKAFEAVRAEKSEKGGRKYFLADDSGLCVDVLGGAPGLDSAIYAPTDNEKIGKLLKNLASADDRKAHYICVLVLCDAQGKILHTVEGFCHGKIAQEPCGKGGFGYDPIFIYEGHDCTIAELSNEEKNLISHRGKALREMLEWVNSNLI